jgi:hypothetical protein
MRIFSEAGLPVEVLGRSRISSFFKLLRQQKEKGLAFNEGSEPHSEQPDKRFDFPIPPKRGAYYKARQLSDTELAKMQHQVAYMAQELEFIKKIILAGNGGKSK